MAVLLCCRMAHGSLFTSIELLRGYKIFIWLYSSIPLTVTSKLLFPTNLPIYTCLVHSWCATALIAARKDRSVRRNMYLRAATGMG